MDPTTAKRPGRDWVAIVLAVGIALAINVITFAVLYDAIYSDDSGLSENATQVLTTAFAGMVGVLGGYVGVKAGEAQQGRGTDPPQSGPPLDDV